MLRKRITTAIFLIILLWIALYRSPFWTLQALVLVAILFSLAEYNQITMSKPLRYYRIWAIVGGMIVAGAQTFRPSWLPIDAVLIGVTFMLALAYMWRIPICEPYAARWSSAVLGSVYIGLTLPYFCRMRVMEHGQALVVMTIAMIALSDTGAYMVGKLIGQHKMAPIVSPNKTMEGFAGGFLGSMSAMFVVRGFLWPELSLWPAVGLAIIIGFMAPMGDLIESALKRGKHVKDSGTALPGHGGLLDRCDAYYFGAPVVYYYVNWLMV